MPWLMSVIKVPYPPTTVAHVPHHCTSLKLRESFGILCQIWVGDMLLVQLVQQLHEWTQSVHESGELMLTAQPYMGQKIIEFFLSVVAK